MGVALGGILCCAVIAVFPVFHPFQHMSVRG